MRWIVAAGVVCSVMPQVSVGAVVQITLLGNYVSESVDRVNYDLTGDGEEDLGYGLRPNQTMDANHAALSLPTLSQALDGCPLTNPPPLWCFTLAYARQTSDSSLVGVRTGADTYGVPLYEEASGILGASVSALADFWFRDSRFGDKWINGWLQIDASTSYSRQDGRQAQITLSRLLWDDENLLVRPEGLLASDGAYPEARPIPEPSSLAMLALFAAGVLARRVAN